MCTGAETVTGVIEFITDGRLDVYSYSAGKEFCELTVDDLSTLFYL